MIAAPRLLLPLVMLMLAACGASYDEGVRAYDEGRFEDAYAAFAALDGDGAAPELLHNVALAALRAGALPEAERAASRLASAPHPGDAGLGHFLSGNVAFVRAELAAAQARAVESEPFAFEVAIRHARHAAQAWGRAIVTRDEWPEAGRNVARAVRLAETLREEQREAERTRDRKTAGGGGARLRPVPVDVNAGEAGADGPEGPEQAPPPDAGAETEPGEAAAVSDAELTPDEVLALVERLTAKDREKRDVRRRQRRAARSGVEKDW